MMRSRTSRVAAALSLLALLLVACEITITIPEPDLRITAERVTNDPGEIDSITIPGGERRVVEVQYRAITTSPALMFFEVQGSGVDGTVRVEFRSSEPYRLLVASQSSLRFARQVNQLVAQVEDHLSGRADGPVERSIALTWECFGPCVARPYQAGTYLVLLDNTSSTSRTVSLYAYGLEPTDPNEPNDTPATATEVELASAGDGAFGAIEHVDDVDHFRLTCSGEFAEGMRLTLVSDFDRAIVLRADGSTYPPDTETDPIACGSTVSVSTSDGTAGPSLHSNYSIVADPAALFELDVPAQGLISVAPTSRGTVTVPANRSRLVRLTFPSASDSERHLRYVEIAGANVEPRVRLQVFADGESVGVSDRRDLFASSLSALSLGAVGVAADRAAIGVVWNCEGPCVAERYRAGEVIARITNTSASSRTVDVYAYGTAEGDLNEPNDRPQDATEFLVEAEGDVVIGALERIGDVDYFRFACSAGFADLRLTLASEFRGDIVMDVPGRAPVGPGTARVVDCNALVSVYTRDDTAGPSAASRYRIEID